MLQPASPQPLRLAPPGCLKRIRAIIRFHTFAFGIVVDLHSPHEAKWGDKMIFAWIGPIPSEVLFRQTLPHFAKYQNIVIVFKLLLARLTLLFFCCCIFHSNFPHDGSPSSRKHIQKSNAKQEVVVLPSFIIYFKNPVEYAVHDALNAKKLALQEYVSTTSSKTVFLSIFIDGIKIKPINGLITPPPPFSWMNSRRRHYPRARITKVTWPKSENAMPAVGCQLQSSVGGMCSLVHHQKVNQ